MTGVRPRVFVTRALPGNAIDDLREHADVDVWPDELPPPYDDLRARVRDCDGLLCMLTDRIDAGVIASASRLRVISTMAVGYDNIDLAAATARRIPVGHTPGVLTDTTADLAVALMLAGARRIAEGDRYVRDGRWRTWHPSQLLGRDVHGATLGIVGYGKIGQAVARRAEGFHMAVLATPRGGGAAAPPAERVELPELLRRADFVTLHVPLSEETRHLIGARELALMQPHALLVNTARGAVVDQAALEQALHAGTIGGAALDVTEVEPLPPGDALLNAPNVTVLPHVGSATHATRGRMAEMAVANCIAGLRGEPLRHCANAALLARANPSAG